MKAHHGALALLFSFACTSTNSGGGTNSGGTTGSDGGGATGGKTSSPDAAYVCPCPGGNCPTLEVLNQVLATPGGMGGWRPPVPSTVEGAVPFYSMQIGCGLRLVYEPGGTDAGYGYAFDLTTGALVGASVFNDVQFSGCGLFEYRWGDTSLFRMYLQGGMNCPDKVQCTANGDFSSYANWTCPSPSVDAGFDQAIDVARADAAKADRGTDASSTVVDTGSADHRRVDCTGTCTFTATYTLATDGFFAQLADSAILSPPQGYRHIGRFISDGGSISQIACAPTLPLCSAPGPVSVCDISQDLADSDVQQALAAPTPPFFGEDERGMDVNALSFMRDDGHGFLVGRTPCTTAACRAIPSGIARLVADLHALDAAAILSTECQSLDVSLNVAGKIGI
jgi:hypothetical protein